jgi:hypothetical protein
MPDIERPTPIFTVHNETVWVVCRTGDGDSIADVHSTQDAAEGAVSNGEYPWGVEAVKATLHRPSLRPVYGGPTLIENLWAEMDAIMERLMTGQQAEDGGDRFRAEELAWVLAIVTNAYDPDINRIRRETMARWEAAEREAALQEEALNPDQGDGPMEPGGMMGDGIK